jgi:hypothetical protein
MIKELSDGLKSLAASLSIRPVATLMAVLIICLGYVSYRSYSTLESMIVTPAEEASRFKEQLESAKLVNESLNQLNADLNGHSVIIRQFHNGRHDLTGIPFTETTSTYYTEDYELSGDEPVSSMNESLRMIWKEIDKPECTVLYGPVDSSSRRYFKAYNLSKVVQCPLTNLLNYPIGTITVGFSAGDTNDTIAVSKTSAIAKRVTGYLTNGY